MGGSPLKHPDLRQGKPRKAQTPPRQLPALVGAPEVPPCPSDLGTTGSRLWIDLWTFGAGAYHPVSDRNILARYCQLIERRDEMLAELETEGWTSTGSQGQPTAHPLARMVESTEQRLQSIEDRLGLNPESRIRLNIQTNTLRRSALDAFDEED